MANPHPLPSFYLLLTGFYWALTPMVARRHCRRSVNFMGRVWVAALTAMDRRFLCAVSVTVDVDETLRKRALFWTPWLIPRREIVSCNLLSRDYLAHKMHKSLRGTPTLLLNWPLTELVFSGLDHFHHFIRLLAHNFYPFSILALKHNEKSGFFSGGPINYTPLGSLKCWDFLRIWNFRPLSNS